jgi:maltose O-acetyltransferase
MTTEREKMLSGALYNASDPELAGSRRRARTLLRAFNASRDEEQEERRRILGALFGAAGEGLAIEPPFFCDYGSNIRLGDRVYFNFNCVILDPAQVTIGSDVLFGPGVQIYTATHPIDPRERRSGLEGGRPIVIGSDVWVGGAAILCPGVRVGDRSVIGAGSVVTRDIPEGVVAAGNPCRVLRSL